MDPVQFGMVMLINCALGLNTPPVGTTQFVGCAIGGVSVGYVMRTIWPFYGALIAALMLVTYVPGVFDVAAARIRLPGLALFFATLTRRSRIPQGGNMNSIPSRRHFLHAVAVAVSLCLAPLASAAPVTINVVDQPAISL